MFMRVKFLLLLFPVIFVIYYQESFSQEKKIRKDSIDFILDSLIKKGIIFRPFQDRQAITFNKDQALRYLQSICRKDIWENNNDPLKKAIGQLIWFASNKPYDTTKIYLEQYPFDSLSIPWEDFFIWDTLTIKIPVSKPGKINPPSNSLVAADTIIKKMPGDSVNLRALKNLPEPATDFRGGKLNYKDSTLLVISDTLDRVLPSQKGFPFKFYNYPYETDSIKTAIKSLLNFLEERDSSVISLTGISDLKTPVWINSKSGKIVRFWLKNEFSDSVTVWIGGVSRNTLGLYLEEGVIFRRPTKQSGFAKAQLSLNKINSSRLQDMKKNYIKPQYWRFRTESALTLTQASLTNWVTGGESSISTSMDITGYANYDNKTAELFSNNFVRLKYGFVASKTNGLRKNMDLLETNSKLNHKAFGKFDVTVIMLFKTQIVKGYEYPNDSIAVSKFLNPAILTLGLGLDYKPTKTTSISFAPLSYKITFVTDTSKGSGIDQTKYGIPKNKKSLHEPGASLLISNELNLFKRIGVINRLQLFTNYIHNPQNVDVDWEIIATARINWFTDVRFNTHLIFDDDTRTPVFTKDGKPVPGSDGLQKKTARIQFKELLGFSFVFRF
jgi:hypothetical protein